MLQKIITASIVSGFVLAISNPALAIQFRFIKLADTQTVMPGDGRPFTHFDSASISGTSVVFRGTIGQPGDPTYREGIYLLRDRRLTKIVDRNTPSPTPNFKFNTFLSPILSGNNVAFLSSSTSQSPASANLATGSFTIDTLALYTLFDGKPLTAIADPYTRPANNNPYFWQFGTTTRNRFTPPPIHMDGTSIVFEGGYGYFKGNLKAVSYRGSSPRISVNRVVTIFPSTPSDRPSLPSDGGRIQLTIGRNTPTTIIDATTQLPNGKYVRDVGYRLISYSTVRGVPTYPISPPVISANTVFFFANDTDGQGGLYTRDDRRIREIIRQGAVIPDFGSVNQFGPLAISGINQAFSLREGAIQTAIAMRTGGQILKVAKIGDSIDGKKITRILPLGTQFLSGRTLVFIANFSDASTGIYRAEAFPETVEESIALERDREPD